MASTPQTPTEARQYWLGVLANASLKEIEAAWQQLGDKPRYRLLRPSETGLVMVRGRIGGSGQPFNFGEMTMTRAAVQIIDGPDAIGRTGFGYVAGRSGRRAELVAVFDALLQDPARHDAITDGVVAHLASAQAAAKAMQAARVTASKVDFFTMVRGE